MGKNLYITLREFDGDIDVIHLFKKAFECIFFYDEMQDALTKTIPCDNVIEIICNYVGVVDPTKCRCPVLSCKCGHGTFYDILWDSKIMSLFEYDPSDEFSDDESNDVHIGKSSCGWQFIFNRSMFGLFERLYHGETDLGRFGRNCRRHLELNRSQYTSSVLEEAKDISDQIPPFIIWAIILHPRVGIFDEYGEPQDNVEFLRSVHGKNNERFNERNGVEFRTGPYMLSGSLRFT